MVNQEYEHGDNAAAQLIEIKELIDKITTQEGRTKTKSHFFSIYRNSHQVPLFPSILTPSCCLILNGTKEIHLGQDILHYQTGDYLVSIIDMPVSGQIIGATPESPCIGLHIDFTIQEVASVVVEAGLDFTNRSKELSTGAFIGKSDAMLRDIFIRLLKLVIDPMDNSFLLSLIKRELIFTLLTGEYNHLFFQQAFFNQQISGIGKAIVWIKENFSQSFTAEELAKLSNMSVSSLHQKFKAITTMGPLQYQKQLRLQEARRLMLTGSVDATTASLEVGYQSLSQFNREYKRLFGLPPLKDMKTRTKAT